MKLCHFWCPFITSVPCLIIRRAFKLDEDNALLTYVKQQLIPPTPLSCTPPLLGAQDSIEELPYQRNVRKVVHKISCTTSLLQLLVQVGSKVIESSVVYRSIDLCKLIIVSARSTPAFFYCCEFSFLAWFLISSLFIFCTVSLLIRTVCENKLISRSLNLGHFEIRSILACSSNLCVSRSSVSKVHIKN